MPDRYNKIHIWIGTNFESDHEYKKYFELDYSTDGDTDDPAYRPCAFCKDIGTDWYDEDFIGIIPRLKQETDLDSLLKEASIEPNEQVRVKEECAKLGISKANAIFWYADGDLSMPKPLKENYNKLKYIGIFESN